MDKIDSLFDKIYKPLKKASKNDVQVKTVMDCIFYIHTCIRSRRGEKLLDEIDVSEIEFESYSESESEMSESDDESDSSSDDESDSSSDDETDDEESDSESEIESDEEMTIEISRENLTELYHYITCLTKAKIFDKEYNEIIKGSDDVTVSGILSEVQDDLLECVVILSKYLNNKIDDYIEVEDLLLDIIEDLELCDKTVGDRHDDQIFSLQHRIHWIHKMMFKMGDEDVEERLESFDLSGIKMRR